MPVILNTRAILSLTLEVSAPHLHQHGCSEEALLSMLRASGFDVPSARPAKFARAESWDLETALLAPPASAWQRARTARLRLRRLSEWPSERATAVQTTESATADSGDTSKLQHEHMNT